MVKELYTCTLYARRKTSFGSDVEFMSIALIAHNQAEAIGKAIGLCKDKFPSTENWKNHKVAVSKVNRDLIRSLQNDY